MKTYKIFFKSGSSTTICAKEAVWFYPCIDGMKTFMVKFVNDNDEIIALFNGNNIAGEEVLYTN